MCEVTAGSCSGEVTSLQALIEEGRFDISTSRVIEPETGRNMNIADAIEARLLEPTVDPADMMARISALALLKKHMDTRRTGVKHPITGQDLNVEQVGLLACLCPK